MNTSASEIMYQYDKPTAMDRQLDVLQCHADGGLLLGASSLTGRYWLGSLWFYSTPSLAPHVDSCTAGVQLEAGVAGASWVDATHVLVGLDTGGVAVWRLEDDFHTFVQAHSATGHDGVVTSVAVSADSTRALTAAQDKCIKIWDLPTTSLVTSTKAHSGSVSCVDCHPSEPEVFLSCAQDNRILLWDRRKPKPASIITSHPLQNTATTLRWQPGQSHKFAVASESGHVALLDTRAGVENSLLSQPHDRPVCSLAFCTERPSLLASVGEDCRTVVTSVDEVEGMKTMYKDETHTDFVHGLAWLKVSQLYTCAWDGRVLEHEPLSGKPPAILGQSSSTSTNSAPAKGSNSQLHSGSGDHSGLTNGLSNGSTKSSYSSAVKVSQEIKTEG